MSSNGSADGAPHLAKSPNALDVGFSSISSGRHGESSSMAESRSSGKTSTRSWRKSGQDEAAEEPVTPEYKRKRREENSSSPSSVGNRPRRSGGFLLDSAFVNGSPKGPQDTRSKRKAQDVQLQVDKRRQAQNRVSGESSQRGSPLVREVAWVDGESDQHQSSRTPSMDPAQLVQMALNLSESRKRNVSNTLQVPLPSSKRVTSMPVSSYGTGRTSSAARKRSSQISDSGSRDSPRSNVSQEVDVLSSPGPDNAMYIFSPATLARAEKARKYFELASEHRRLLEHLPPLIPDANAPGNYTFESRNQPGSAFPEIRRVNSGADERHALGRQYNPIQALRNRRVRIREKRPFPAPLDSWTDPDDVGKWIDDVERATQNPYYRATADVAQVPRFNGDNGTNGSRMLQSSSTHRRTDTVGSVITRPENSWTIEPTELLADSYWTEKEDNKAYIENRHGNPIFGHPEGKRPSTPKISVELHRGRENQNAVGVEKDDLDESNRPSRRRRLMLPLSARTDEHRKKYRRLTSRSSSTSSGSSTDDGRRSRDGEENIGPLERHMRELIAKDEKGELSSPDMVSPMDHWDSKPAPQPRPSIDQVRRDAFSHEGRGSLEVPRDLHRRTRSADGRVDSANKITAATEEDEDNGLTSPKLNKTSSTTNLDRIPTVESRRSLDEDRSQTFKFPSFSRPRSKERNNIDEVDFAAAATSALSPIMSGDQWRPRTSQDTQRPVDYRRHRTNESMSGSLQRLDTGSTSGTFTSIREPGSTVGRLFKGGRDRIGTLVRGERFRNRDRLDPGTDQYRGASDVSDLEDADGTSGHLVRRGTDSPGNDSDVSPRASLDKARSKQKYQLPAFTSSSRARRMVPGTPISPDTNPFETRKSPLNDTAKNQRLIPPRISIPQDDSASNAAPMATAIRFDTNRKSYGQLGINMPTPNSTGISRSPGQRHWSIYDQIQPLPLSTKITTRDIARARALLLCSGIKAREIYRRGNSPVSPPSSALLLAASTTSQPIPSPLLKDEALTAANLLSAHLSQTLTNHESLLASFQTQTARGLASILDELRQTVSDRLAPAVHDAADAADAFNVELTTRQPQQTKRVDEAVDTLVRRRRRQFRLLRQVGFKLLEWVVLGIMWGIWFTVVIINLARKGVVGVGRGIRWLVVF